ncbi:hypothetical protein [Bradyrhizobium sp. BRP23]|uniref:PD-(D/E)XK nuclease domain-containing protein n=1 Tax=Bradyrhizobium sp. BRP23 TaxID=2793820 RepID=UPI001CD35914|nr:hypothetical protein [Bradyrhizobium sp. BRP23]MCA1381457.1 hypothetical protein [Bradyrhizobium sp. BRP05]MCA1422287.1 hypothetical protein [Bradyrhizobium sp. BRP23]
MSTVGREEQLLASRLADILDSAAKAERNYIGIVETSTAEQLDDLDNDELHEAEERLTHLIDTAFHECQMLAERLRMPDTARSIQKKREAFDGTTKLISLRYSTAAGEQYCPALAEVWNLYEPLGALALSGAVTGLSVLRTLLGNTAKVIERAAEKPDREAAVRNAILEILKLAFSDARKETTIAKSFKTYQPDIGIPSLLAAVEYKYLRSREDMKSYIDEVCADVLGYGGHLDWRNFYAVFYQKGPFYTQDEVEAIFREMQIPSNWIPIVLNGPGS